MGKLFGTDGIRGIANEELTGELAYKIGRAGSYFLCNTYQGDDKPVILIGKDTRVSGDMLESALVSGITSVGINVIQLGILPTPGLAYLTAKLDVQGGIMISASHNPIADNGIKFFDGNGYKLTDEAEIVIEDIIFNKFENVPSPTHEDIGRSEINESLVNKYIDYLVNTVDVDFKGLKIVLDCANGAAYHVSPEVFVRLGAELVVINHEPDGGKINVQNGSTHPEVIRDKVLECKADIGIAHDGDADRLIMIDEKGGLVDGDKIMAILALDMLKDNKLNGKTVVTTRYSNFGLKELLGKYGADTKITRNGDRYVLQEMKKNNYNLGGEKSGHIIMLDYNQTGDGVLTGLQITGIVKKRQLPLSKLAGEMQTWPQVLKNIKVKNKEEWKSNKEINKVIESAQQDLGNNGSIFVRASGTEPVIRVMIEAKQKEKITRWIDKIKDIISRELN